MLLFTAITDFYSFRKVKLVDSEEKNQDTDDYIKCDKTTDDCSTTPLESPLKGNLTFSRFFCYCKTFPPPFGRRETAI